MLWYEVFDKSEKRSFIFVTKTFVCDEGYQTVYVVPEEVHTLQQEF